MPVLLAPEQAPTLHELLAEANTIGLDCIPVNPSTNSMPRIRGIGSLVSAGPAEISFLSNPKLRDQLLECKAAAVDYDQGSVRYPRTGQLHLPCCAMQRTIPNVCLARAVVRPTPDRSAGNRYSCHGHRRGVGPYRARCEHWTLLRD